jgi:NAD(P)-dependent dehydrogenase (short-subunit alcohol dehydrogenase family)
MPNAKETIPKEEQQPQQHQERPGAESKMTPEPIYDYPEKKGSGKLEGKVALITGGDSGIGRAVAVLFAKEGADIAIAYWNEDNDAEVTKESVTEYGRQCLTISGDIANPKVPEDIVQQTIDMFGRIDVLVNNAALHWEASTLEELSDEQLLRTYEVNLFSQFRVTRAALSHLQEGSAIICTTSVTAYRGSKEMIDYASTKSAIVGFIRSLAQNLVEKKIRVNGVAPGPIWTPLIVSSKSPEDVAKFGSDVPMKRVGQPAEVAPAFLYLACDDSSYVTGQVIHVNGGEIVNG